MIPTAEELLRKYENTAWTLPDVMREFAKLHVEEALRRTGEDALIIKDMRNPIMPIDKLISFSYP